MALHRASGRMWLTNGAGTVTWDTAAGMFRSMSFVQGYVDMPSRTATSTPTTVTPVNADEVYTLSGVSPAATDVIGMVQLVRTGASSADPAGRWQMINGSKLDFHWFCGPLSSIGSPTDLIYDAGIGWIEFDCAAGNLTMREIVSLRAAQGTSGTFAWTRPATRVHVRLFCGAFV